MDKMELSFENLGAPDAQEGMDAKANSAFSLSRAQWNSLVGRVETLASELETACEAISATAEVSDERLEIVDGQVTNLRGSIGCPPSLLGPNLPALNLWSNAAKLADEVAVSNESVNLPAAPSSYEKMTRSMTETVQQVGGKLASDLLRPDAKKAECVGQVKPLEAVVQDVTDDLCSP
jgi:hypothetical protein